MKSVCEGINENSHQILDGWNLQDQAMSVDAERKWCFYSCLLPPWWDENLHSAETQKYCPPKPRHTSPTSSLAQNSQYKIDSEAFLLVCPQSMQDCLFFAFRWRWGTSFLWSAGPPGWGVQLHRRDLAPRCWVSAPRREGAWFGWLTSRWIPMVSCSLGEGECFFGDWKVWGYKVFQGVDAEIFKKKFASFLEQPSQ